MVVFVCSGCVGGSVCEWVGGWECVCRVGGWMGVCAEWVGGW